MADVRAIMAVSQALVGTLEGSYDPELFGTELEFETFSTSDFVLDDLEPFRRNIHRVRQNLLPRVLTQQTD